MRIRLERWSRSSRIAKDQRVPPGGGYAPKIMSLLFDDDNVTHVSIRRVSAELVVVGGFRRAAGDGVVVVEEFIIRQANSAAGNVRGRSVVGKHAVRNIHLAAGVGPDAAGGAGDPGNEGIANRDDPGW